jgi:hypothetical protein
MRQAAKSNIGNVIRSAAFQGFIDSPAASSDIWMRRRVCRQS